MTDRAYWSERCHLSGEELARQEGGDGGNWRKRIRKAKQEHPDLSWRTDARSMPLPEVVPAKALKGVAVFDLHYPCHDKRLWRNITRFVSDFTPDVFVFGGDNLDCEPVSHWVGNKRRTVEGKRLKRDYNGFNANVLGKLELPDDARRIFHLGNHEDWVAQYIDVHPEVEGFLEIENNLHLDGWEVYNYGSSSQVGKLHFHHGEYCLKHHAARTVEVFHRNIAYGHLHTFQAHTTVTPMDTEAHAAVSIPCACGLNPHYARNKPNAWVNGFAVFYVAPDGSFNLFPVIAVDSAFTAPNGVRYE